MTPDTTPPGVFSKELSTFPDETRVAGSGKDGKERFDALGGQPEDDRPADGSDRAEAEPAPKASMTPSRRNRA